MSISVTDALHWKGVQSSEGASLLSGGAFSAVAFHLTPPGTIEVFMVKIKHHRRPHQCMQTRELCHN